MVVWRSGYLDLHLPELLTPGFGKPGDFTFLMRVDQVASENLGNASIPERYLDP